MKQLKGHQISKKGTVELQKGKRTAGYPFSIVFFSFSDQVHFFQFFERGNEFECWMHKMFRLGPAVPL